MAKKPKKQAEKPEKPVDKRAGRDYAQRAHDTVRDMEERHAERHKDDDPD